MAITVKFQKQPRGLYFSKVLFEGLIFGGAYVRREICASKSIGLALFLLGNLPFSLFYFVFEGNFQIQAPREGLINLAGRFNKGFFALRAWGAHTWRGLFSEFYGISTYLLCQM